jgi:hypothetical protein
MATTTNYGWTTPDDTALVKDGASAIRTLGSSVDTTTKALNPSTTLGDVEYRSSTANTNTRLGIGTTGQVLTVSGGVPSWATASSGGMTLISTTTLTGASVTLSSIPQTYINLQLVLVNPLQADDATSYRIRVNADNNTRYANVNAQSLNKAPDANDYVIASLIDNTVSESTIQTTFLNYTGATRKFAQTLGIGSNSTTSANFNIYMQNHAYNQTTAITSLVVQPDSGNWTSGSALLYGVK